MTDSAAPSDPDPRLKLNAAGSGRIAWYEDLRVIGILLVLVGVLALPLVWFNRKMTLRKKLIISVVSVVLAILFIWIGNRIWGVLDRPTS